ncbi:hypothetical protein M5D96_007162, partial [Drosophila gunungcola]
AAATTAARQQQHDSNSDAGSEKVCFLHCCSAAMTRLQGNDTGRLKLVKATNNPLRWPKPQPPPATPPPSGSTAYSLTYKNSASPTTATSTNGNTPHAKMFFSALSENL